jgi:tetratricopeptide (TPR) repeat protein
MFSRKRNEYSFERVMALEGLAEEARAEGRLEEAVSWRYEAIAIQEHGDDASMIGGSRWELVADLLALGRNEEAIAAAELAVSDWDRARDTPHWILGVGCSLNLLSRAHAAAGHWDAALAAADEAVGIFRANGGGPDLIEALNHRSTALAAM